MKRILQIIILISVLCLSLLNSQDGPYVFYTGKPDSVIIIRTDLNNTISIDTLKTPDQIKVQIPGTEKYFDIELGSAKVQERCVFPEPEMLFAVSDIEGNYADFVTILTNNRIIDKNLNWTFGNGHLVLDGDFVDRGEFVTQELWLIYKLEREAEAAGGKVHYLLGNHELMLLRGDDRYAVEKYHTLAEKTNRNISDYFSPDTHFGQWLRTKNVVEKIGANIFVHGGLNDFLLMNDLSLKKINTAVRKNIDIPDSLFDKTNELIFGSFGPLWYRGLVAAQKKYDKIKKKELKKILSYYDADRIVVGHCIVDDISTDFKGKVVMIDVDHYENESSGIFIENGKVYKAMKSGKKKKLKE